MKFKVVMETTVEEVIEVDAEDETEASNMAANGEGFKVDEVLTWPTIIAVEELEPEWEPEING